MVLCAVLCAVCCVLCAMHTSVPVIDVMLAQGTAGSRSPSYDLRSNRGMLFFHNPKPWWGEGLWKKHSGEKKLWCLGNRRAIWILRGGVSARLGPTVLRDWWFMLASDIVGRKGLKGLSTRRIQSSH